MNSFYYILWPASDVFNVLWLLLANSSFRRAVPEFCCIEEPIRTQRITVGRPPSR